MREIVPDELINVPPKIQRPPSGIRGSSGLPVSFSQVRLNILYLYLHGGGGLVVWRRFVKKKSDPSKFLQSTHKFIVLITFLYFQIYFPPIHVFGQALTWGLINPLTAKYIFKNDQNIIVSNFRLQLQKFPREQCWHRTDVHNIYYGSREWVKLAKLMRYQWTEQHICRFMNLVSFFKIQYISSIWILNLSTCSLGHMAF